MKRYEMFKYEDIDYIAKIIASFLDEEINIVKAPEGSSCSNCYWNDFKESRGKSCNPPFHYIGMQYYDCCQYKPL